VTREHFDSIHAKTCDRIISSFKTNRNEKLSYGQAQKALNVFLKVYVDWAKRPNKELADKLAPFLHVPLDSLLMRFIAREFKGEYETRITSIRMHLAERTAERLKERLPGSTPRAVERALLGNEFSLVGINKEIYLAWQEFLRSLWPGKPLMLDIIWVLERARIARGRAEEEDI
jgi:hypothetical protein